MSRWCDLRRRCRSAQWLLDRFGLDKPPIDVFGLARRMGVEICEEQDMALSGRLVVEGDCAKMYVNVKERPKRQRFTIAHQLGHLMFHPLDRVYVETTYKGSQLESEAAVLMPAHLVCLYAEATTDPDKLAAVFQVGWEAMQARTLDVLHGIRSQ